jgi:hypothetical protein
MTGITGEVVMTSLMVTAMLSPVLS